MMWNQAYRKTDVEEAGGDAWLYPVMTESPEVRWNFIRKVYCIISVQLLATIAVAAVVVYFKPVSHFVTSTSLGLTIYIIFIIMPFIVLCPLYFCHQKHPMNYVLLGIFTLAIAFTIGLTCAFSSGKVILESAILTGAVVVSLSIYTFWAAKRGHDFNFLGSFLFGSLIILIVFGLIQILFPMGKLGEMLYGGIASIIFCGYIVHDTDNLIKRYTYDEYIWAAVSLYFDVIKLFFSLLTILRASDS